MPELDAPMLFEEHKRWAKTHAPASLTKQAHDNEPDADRRLRIGYISPDFRTHPVAHFVESLLDGHDPDAVEIYGYGNVACPDHTTERLRSKFAHYRSILGLADDEVVHLVERDKVDILVDLAGHTSGNRLSVLARKPAPVQVTYLGYPDTTGMEQIDYRLTDSLSTPPELQKFYTEELVFLPDGFLCYRPADFAPPVAPLPAKIKGHITFGSFNNSCKLSPNMMSLWARLLSTNAGSRLLLKSRAGDDAGVREDYFRHFEQLGIPRDRLNIRGQKPAIEYLQLFGQVDIALDSFPYNGTTTTCDAMWMGVPVITLVGQHHASRVGLSILTQVGLEFFAASKPAEYVRKATALAQNLGALAKIRASMRQRMAASPVCQAKPFARTVEAAYRTVWRKWCGTRGSGTLEPIQS
jgi:predicted O-linked N-acetylglucosamine transferase (SPINDLY family)